MAMKLWSLLYVDQHLNYFLFFVAKRYLINSKSICTFLFVTKRQVQVLRTTKPSSHIHHEGRESVILPYLKPRDVLTTLLTEDPWLLLGGLDPSPQAEELLTAFWTGYRLEHATHKVFQMAQDNLLDLKHTIPLMIHGDGGRTSKKQPLEVVSLIAVLGLDTKKSLICRCPNPVDFTKNRTFQDLCLQKLNNKNNSYLSHFLLFAFPSKKFKKTPGLLKAMLRVVSDDIASCCTNGIVVKNQRWNFGVIGLRGDAEWHAKTGVLNRSYQNVGHKNDIACCHLCDAGAPGIPFEDFRSGAAWKSTMGRYVPWNEPPPYSSIPFEPWHTGGSAKFFRYDPLHVFRLGIVRNFIASCLIMLCTDGYYDFPGDSQSVPERLSRAWMSFSLFCETKKFSPASLRSFSREKLHYATTTSFPFVGCKGSDSVLLLKYLQWFAGLNIQTGQNTNALQLIKLGCDHGLGFQAIHGHGLWLPPSCRDEIYRCAKGFCHTYGTDCYGASTYIVWPCSEGAFPGPHLCWLGTELEKSIFYQPSGLGHILIWGFRWTRLKAVEESGLPQHCGKHNFSIPCQSEICDNEIQENPLLIGFSGRIAEKVCAGTW